MAQAYSASWVTYDDKRDACTTPDGTFVPAILTDTAQCLADVLHIAGIREKQRAAGIGYNLRGKILPLVPAVARPVTDAAELARVIRMLEALK